LRRGSRKKWIVYAKPPAAGPDAVFGYLARYTHRVAIANSRPVSFARGAVRFGYTDRAAGGQERIRELAADEFRGGEFNTDASDPAYAQSLRAHSRPSWPGSETCLCIIRPWRIAGTARLNSLT